MSETEQHSSLYNEFVAEYGDSSLPEGGHFVTALKTGDRDMMTRHWDVQRKKQCLELWSADFFGLPEEEV